MEDTHQVTASILIGNTWAEIEGVFAQRKILHALGHTIRFCFITTPNCPAQAFIKDKISNGTPVSVELRDLRGTHWPNASIVDVSYHKGSSGRHSAIMDVFVDSA